VLPVHLSGLAYRRAHEAAHANALLWNHAVDSVHQFWDTAETDPTIKELRHLVAAADPALLELHSHTKQAITDDLLDAIATCRANKAEGRNGRAPWRTKQYRPLTFTRGYGWRITPTGKLNLSLGSGRPGIRLPLPVLKNARTGQPVDASLWGEIRLCWDRDARVWSLHIAYPTTDLPVLDPANHLGIDPGIINPMTLAAETPTSYEITVINGRSARAVKHRRNTAVAQLRSKMARCTKDSRQWRRYNGALKRDSAAATSSLRNIDHQVTAKAARLATSFDTGTIAIGDVAGIERSTAQRDKRRFGRHQRRRLSQWSRGRQERYLTEKTGVALTHTDESYSSQTCPACLTRNRPTGRIYQCRNPRCQFTCHRDAVGALNILMRSIYGAYTRIDTDKPIHVTYLRATPLRVAPSKALNRATVLSPTSGVRVAEIDDGHATVTGFTAPTARTLRDAA
jgi:transposase